MTESFLFALCFVAIGAFLYYFVKTRFERRVANVRGKRWVKTLRHLGNNMPLEDDSTFELRHGEEFVMNLTGVSLVESRRGPRISKRSTDAFTVSLAKGFYYTAAAGKSYSDEPDDVIREIDTGVATFTTHRVVFVGDKQNREWDFAKLLGTSGSTDGLRLMIGVSNRQKMSGIASTSMTSISPGLAFEVTQAAKQDGWEVARSICLHGAKELDAQLESMNSNTFISAQRLEIEMEQWREANPREELPVEKEAAAEPTQSAKNAPMSEIKVVGETFYKKSFEALRHELKTEGNSEHIVEAELRNDPDNEYSDSGKAVAVYIRDKQVGHVPEWLAPKVFEQLEPEGGSVTLGARLWLDDVSAKPQTNSVTVILDSRLVLA